MLFEIHDANSLVERDLWLVFEGNVIVKLFSKLFSVSSEAIVFLIDPHCLADVLEYKLKPLTTL